MKKNTKYRSNNNYNSQVYSLNYRFDSVSPAGKINGTALDLIKRYNELAKEAQSNADYVEAECYRQYAEHYRKIVTDINERKNQRFNQPANEENKVQQSATVDAANDAENKEEEKKQPEEAASENKTVATPAKRSFTVIEVDATTSEVPVSKVAKRGRPSRKISSEAVAQ